MSLYIDRKFVSLVSSRLDRFIDKGNYIWNFRCPFCGDSKKNKIKSRGYFYRKKSNISFMCHNCGTSISLGTFLKRLDPVLYDEYKMERFKNESHSNAPAPDFSSLKVKPVFADVTIDLPTIQSLEDSHVAKQYVLHRKIPESFWNQIYYSENFRSFVDTILPKNEKKIGAEARIVFPLYDQDKKLNGFQGRSLDDSVVKYITMKMHDDALKIYGLDRVDFSEEVYVLEGIIDSMYVPNSVSLLDATLYRVKELLGEHDYVLVPDRDIRNPDIVKLIGRMIRQNFKVCLLPDDFPGKDINEAVMSGFDEQNIMKVIKENTVQGPEAQLKFGTWRRV